MGFKISGEYITTCDCKQICPCSVDGQPTGKSNQCHGVSVFHIESGNVNGTDLSGVNAAMVYNAPSNFTSGNVKMGLVVDKGASDAQAKATEQIFRGELGGPFAEFVPLIGEWLGTERAPVTYTPGKNASATIGKQEIGFSPFLGADGNPTIVSNAMMAFRAEGYEIGTGTGKVKQLGVSLTSNYGERAKFDFAS